MTALQQEMYEAVSLALKEARPHQTVVMPDARSWSVKECAEYLGISEGLLRSLVSSGRIPHFRLNTRVQFHPHEIRNWKGTTEVSTRQTRAKAAMEQEILQRKVRGAR